MILEFGIRGHGYKLSKLKVLGELYFLLLIVDPYKTRSMRMWLSIIVLTSYESLYRFAPIASDIIYDPHSSKLFFESHAECQPK
jgi:hypothetical protein